MGWISRLRALVSGNSLRPQAAVQSSGSGQLIVTPQQLEDALRSGATTVSGETVTASTALRVGAVYACVRLIAGTIANTPLDVKRRVDERTRESATDQRLRQVLRRRPNPWQTPAQFMRMLTAHVLLNGNGYALIVRDTKGDVQQLIPLAPERTRPEQRTDMKIDYHHTRTDGSKVVFAQKQVLHLMNLTLDGIVGVTPISYARETIGGALAMERHGNNTFRNGAQVTGLLTTEKRLGEAGRANIRAGLDEFRAAGDKAGSTMILEDGLDYKQTGLSAQDAQWIEGRKFTRSDIAMFYGVPPHMIGDTEKTTSWGSGVEQQSIGYSVYTAEDYYIMWEQGLNVSCLREEDADLYTRFNRAALVRGDIKTRKDFHVAMLQWGVFSPNEVRAFEDKNPRADGDVYYDPPNTAGMPSNERKAGQ